MKTNATVYKDNIATLQAVNAGEVDGGVIYHYYWFRDQAKTKEISGNAELHYFKNEDPGAFVSLSGGGVLKSSKNQDQAQQFLKFITGKAGQEVLQKGTSFEYPVASDVAANPRCRRWSTCRHPRIDPSTLDADKVTDLMTKAACSRWSPPVRGPRAPDIAVRPAAARPPAALRAGVAACSPRRFIPLGYVGLGGDPDRLGPAYELVVRPRVGELLLNTVGWWSSPSRCAWSSGSAGRGWWSAPTCRAARAGVLLVAPLAVPAFVNSYAWVGVVPSLHGLGPGC